MKSLKRSWVLILVALGLALNMPSLKANESASQVESQNRSQKPPPSSEKLRQTVQKIPTSNKKATPEDQRGTEEMPLVIKGMPTEKTPEQAAEDRKERDIKTAIDRDLAGYTGWQAIFTLVLIVVGIFQLGFFVWQLRLIQKSLADTKIAAQAAKINADAALEQAKAITLSERAYVGMSHTPPGLIQLPPPDSVYKVEMEIRNVGRTPATITDVVLDVSVLDETESLAAILKYPVNAPGLAPEIFLYADGFFFAERRFPISGDVMDDIQTHKKTLILFGYVDYIDQFGRRHRSGYARRYNPADKNGNLHIAIKKGYNYDRERQRGEGNDWDTP